MKRGALSTVCGFATQYIRDTRGQATVEAALMIPLVMLLLLLLLQPGIILYDRMVMRAAAAEGCRALVTAGQDDIESCKAYVLRRLGSIPPQDLFHVHNGGCSWQITLEGSESSSEVVVTIENKVKPLPLIGAIAGLSDALDEQGYLTIRVQESLETQPSWVPSSSDPASWVGAWAQ